MGSQSALNALNFFMADVRDGLGPFLGVYLQSEKWSPAEIGLVMTIGALVGMAATAPLGALVDRVRQKRAMVVVSAVITVLASMMILFVPGFAPTAVAQSINGVAGAAIAPAIAGITLGLVGQQGYGHQIGRNEAFNHAGNVTAAVLAGGLGYFYGIGAVFVVMAAMAGASLIATWFIDPRKIDHRMPHGQRAGRPRLRLVDLGHFETSSRACGHASSVSPRQCSDAAAAWPIHRGGRRRP